LILGGSFDPVHDGHVALAKHFIQRLQPDELRLVPAGDPWQKAPLQASPEDRVRMLELAFAGASVPVVIDRQEVERQGPSFAVDTLHNLRVHFGPQVSLVFMIGADQLRQLHTWHDWKRLFELAHVCAASRPGHLVDDLPPEVREEFLPRLASAEALKNRPHGSTLLATDLNIDISSTAIRAALRHAEPAGLPLPPQVLDYIHCQHLYHT
jgi:nicotinate-nucleotide adenylyltransferase